MGGAERSVRDAEVDDSGMRAGLRPLDGHGDAIGSGLCKGMDRLGHRGLVAIPELPAKTRGHGCGEEPETHLQRVLRASGGDGHVNPRLFTDDLLKKRDVRLGIGAVCRPGGVVSKVRALGAEPGGAQAAFLAGEGFRERIAKENGLVGVDPGTDVGKIAGFEARLLRLLRPPWGRSSIGRAQHWQC